MVPHPYMVQDALRDPPRPAHQDILEEEQAMTYHVVDVLPRCRYIMQIMKECIDR